MGNYLMAKVPASQFWKEQSQISPSNAFMAKLSSAYLDSPARRLTTNWLRKCSIELAASSRSFQLAVSLSDLFFSQHHLQDFSERLVVSAAALMAAMNTIESFEMSADYASRLPGITATAMDIVQTQHALLVSIDWALDLPTASDIISYLCATLEETPPKEKWEQWVDRCYQLPTMRFGPFLIAVAGYYALRGVQPGDAESIVPVGALLEELERMDCFEGESPDSLLPNHPNK
jgi:hypothetical protein